MLCSTDRIKLDLELGIEGILPFSCGAELEVVGAGSKGGREA